MGYLCSMQFTGFRRFFLPDVKNPPGHHLDPDKVLTARKNYDPPSLIKANVLIKSFFPVKKPKIISQNSKKMAPTATWAPIPPKPKIRSV